ncbi:MAG: heavy-metal-associated domain-containing protein [Deltaproteobacteria bacterium]|nr:heavy-metal-associated domain-containing protein [Deltaproteobacteria bacterium]MBW2218316.1 heavy-metal-associated domain-containing protein [Deltaproteobacteria bacterium]
MKKYKLKMRILCIILTAFFFSWSNAVAGEITRTTMKVSNLYCGACLIHIDTTLKGMPEVTGMWGNPRQGIVKVDHKPSLKGGTIASAITGLGYPAEIELQETIDEEKAFSFNQAGSNQGSCCSTGGSKKYRGCGASAASWKKLFGITPKE